MGLPASSSKRRPAWVGPAPQVAIVLASVPLAAIATTVEFAEFTADRVFGTHAQLGLDDTLLDMAMGIARAVAYASTTWARGALGAVAPVHMNAAGD